MNRHLFTLFVALIVPTVSHASIEIGAVAGASFGNTKVPAPLYESPSFLTGAEATYGLSENLRLGAFWDFNNITAKSGVAAPFDKGADVSGPLHFYGVLLRTNLVHGLPLFTDIKLGYNSRSVGAPPVASTPSPGVGVAVGYALALPLSGFSASPRLGYRALSYRVDGVGNYMHQSIDLDVLLSYAF